MKPINSAFLSYLTSELNGGADIDELIHEYYNVNPNDPIIMKKIIKNILKPGFDEFSAIFKQKVKDCLGFYLSTEKINFERVYDSNLLPIETPKDAKLFYIWIWEVFFDNENYKLYNDSEYFEQYDLDEPIKS